MYVQSKLPVSRGETPDLLDQFVVKETFLKTEDLSVDERDTLKWRTCLFIKETLLKNSFFFVLGSIIFSLRYTVPTSGL